MQGIGSLEQIYANLDQIATLSFRGAKNFAPKLEAEKANADLSYLLATIKTDVELDVTHDQLLTQPQDRAELAQLFEHYEFKRWLNEVNQNANPVTQTSAEKVPNNYQVTQAVRNEENVANVVEIDCSKYETVDTEQKLSAWIRKTHRSSFDCGGYRNRQP